jgi:hypothetical protein
MKCREQSISSSPKCTKKISWVLLLMKMVSAGQKLSKTANRVKNKVACFSNEITERKATML